eukprot:15372534-Alexandrium_andersonii.AAC.1
MRSGRGRPETRRKTGAKNRAATAEGAKTAPATPRRTGREYEPRAAEPAASKDAAPLPAGSCGGRDFDFVRACRDERLCEGRPNAQPRR